MARTRFFLALLFLCWSATAHASLSLPVPAGAELEPLPSATAERFQFYLSGPNLPRHAVMYEGVGQVEALQVTRIADRSFVVWCGTYRARAVWGLLWITASGSLDGAMGGADDEVARAGCHPEVVAVGREALVTPAPGLTYRCYSRHTARLHSAGCDRVANSIERHHAHSRAFTVRVREPSPLVHSPK